MNFYAYWIVNHHIDFLLEESAKRQRIAMLFPEPTLRSRIGAAVGSLSRILANRIDLDGSVLPELEDYPYRG